MKKNKLWPGYEKVAKMSEKTRVFSYFLGRKIAKKVDNEREIC